MRFYVELTQEKRPLVVNRHAGKSFHEQRCVSNVTQALLANRI